MFKYLCLGLLRKCMSVYSVWLYFFSAEESHIILDRKLSDSSDNWRNRMWEKQNKALVTVLSPGRGRKWGAGSRHMRNPFNFVQYACITLFFIYQLVKTKRICFHLCLYSQVHNKAPTHYLCISTGPSVTHSVGEEMLFWPLESHRQLQDPMYSVSECTSVPTFDNRHTH